MKIFVNVEWLLTEIERVSPQIDKAEVGLEKAEGG